MTEPRKTTDTVVLLFAATVVFVVIVTTIGILLSGWLWPDADMTSWAGVLHQLVVVMLGGVAGFVFGRKVNGIDQKEGTP